MKAMDSADVAFLERIDRFLIQAGLNKISKFQKSLIHIGSKLSLQPSSLLYRFLRETVQFFEVHQIEIFKSNESVGLQHHKSLGDDVSADLIRLCFMDVIFPHERSREWIEDTTW